MLLERFINILIIDEDPISREGLATILRGNGNNVLIAESSREALPIISNKEIGILLINIDSEGDEGMDMLRQLKDESLSASTYKIIVTKGSSSATNLVRGLKNGAVDYLTTPFNPNIVKAKIEVFKSLYFKDQRIGQLLSNIFPSQIIEDFNTYGKVSPKRIQNGVVLFTDFVEFSAYAKDMEPFELLRRLESHFTMFDQISKRYAIEKIKTIGDSYMALAGVNESQEHPAIRACMAALEMQQYIASASAVNEGLGKKGWKVRIGIHMGPLVAGIIGTSKYSYDVWGDTVNIAARAEQVSEAGVITITESIAKEISNYFEVTPLGDIPIHKRGGTLPMYQLDGLRPPFSMDQTNKKANARLRTLCGLDPVDFDHMRSNIIDHLKATLPDEYGYHDIEHTLMVEKAVMRIAKLEGITDVERVVLRTAALYHDSGFLFQYENNEQFAVELAKIHLPQFGYSDELIARVCELILSTRRGYEPQNLLEQIMRDADHDYLGRADYKLIARKLRDELISQGIEMDELTWNQFQLNYLENIHRYYTVTANNLRTMGKMNRILELKQNISKLTDESLHKERG